MKNIELSGVLITVGTQEVVPPVDPDECVVTLPLSAYVESLGAIANGVRVTRRQLVQYVANRLGGAHLDQRDREDPANRALDLVAREPRYLLQEQPLVDLELLAIGQAVANSDDAGKLIDAAGIKG